MNITETWFYQTNLKAYTELQQTLLEEKKSIFENESQIISGTVGIGKTYNALLVAKQYMQDTFTKNNYWHYSFEPFFITYMEFAKLLQNKKFGSEAEKSEAYYKLKELEESPFIIFDDLRCKFSSEYEKTTIDNALLDLLSNLWANRQNKTLIVTTNNTRPEIEKNFSEAVCSRLFGLCKYVEVNGKDKRLAI